MNRRDDIMGVNPQKASCIVRMSGMTQYHELICLHPAIGRLHLEGAVLPEQY